METAKLKPSWSKILLYWPLMSLFALLIALLFNGNGPMDLLVLGIAILYVVVASLVFCAIFFHLPYFTISVDNGLLVGPSLLGVGWRRVTIPLKEIDLEATNLSLDWLGFYVIKSTRGKKITLWGFDEKQYEKLLSLLRDTGPG
jgi:hypothetical protein